MYYGEIVGAITDTDENITLNSRNGLPKNVNYYLKISDGSDEEIVQVLSISSYVIFVKRGQAGTIAQSWSDGSVIRLMQDDFYVAGTGVTFTYDVDSDSTIIEATAGSGLTFEQVAATVSMRI